MHSKRNKRKQRTLLPRRARHRSQAQERSARLCGCCWVQSPGARRSRGSGRGPEPRKPGIGTACASGWVRSAPPSPGSTRSPCRNPGNVAAGPGTSGMREGSGLEFLGCFCTALLVQGCHPPPPDPAKVEAHGGDRAHFSRQPLPRPLPDIAGSGDTERQFPASKIPSLCLREEVLPNWKPLGPPLAGVSSWIVAILWQDWVATLAHLQSSIPTPCLDSKYNLFLLSSTS